MDVIECMTTESTAVQPHAILVVFMARAVNAKPNRTFSTNLIFKPSLTFLYSHNLTRAPIRIQPCNSSRMVIYLIRCTPQFLTTDSYACFIPDYPILHVKMLKATVRKEISSYSK